MDPTKEDIEWMTSRAMQLRERRLAQLGKGARLCEQEEEAIIRQALEDGEKRAREKLERAEYQALMDKRDRDAKARAEGKPTLHVTLGEKLGKFLRKE